MKTDYDEKIKTLISIYLKNTTIFKIIPILPTIHTNTQYNTTNDKIKNLELSISDNSYVKLKRNKTVLNTIYSILNTISTDYLKNELPEITNKYSEQIVKKDIIFNFNNDTTINQNYNFFKIRKQLSIIHTTLSDYNPIRIQGKFSLFLSKKIYNAMNHIHSPYNNSNLIHIAKLYFNNIIINHITCDNTIIAINDAKLLTNTMYIIDITTKKHDKISQPTLLIDIIKTPII